MTKIRAEAGDFLLVSFDNRTLLVEMSQRKGDRYSGIVHQAKAGTLISRMEDRNIIFFGGDIQANLGKNPPSGKVYGVDVKIQRATVETALGDTVFYYKASKDDKKKFLKGLTKVRKVMKKFALTSLLPFYIEVIRNPKSKTLGMYYATKQSKKDEDETRLPDRIVYNDILENDVVDTFCHEIGHGIWYRLITKHTIKAKWIKLYTDHVKLTDFSEKDVSIMRKMFINFALPIKDFKKVLKEDYDEFDLNLFNKIISTIVLTHRVSMQEIDELILAGDVETIENIWPTFKLILVNIKDTNISDYAKKNVREFFAECTRIYLTGGKLPKKARKLMEKTLQLSARS